MRKTFLEWLKSLKFSGFKGKGGFPLKGEASWQGNVVVILNGVPMTGVTGITYPKPGDSIRINVSPIQQDSKFGLDYSLN